MPTIQTTRIYLNPTAACQTNTNKKKNKGISGRTSTVGAKAL